MNKDGSRPAYAWSKSVVLKDTLEDKLAFIESQTAKQGRYEVYCAWKGENYGHVFIVERQKSGELLWYDPQSSRRSGCFKNYLSKMNKDWIGVIKIDDKIINTKFSSLFTKAKS